MLETRIEELTAAVKALTEAISKTQAPVALSEESIAVATDITTKIIERMSAQQQIEAPNPVTAPLEGIQPEKKSAPVVTEAEQQSSDTTSGEQSQPTGESSSPELTYVDHVKPATLKLSQKMGREVAIAVLARFGVKGAQNLDASQWADYIAHCESVMNGGEV